MGLCGSTEMTPEARALDKEEKRKSKGLEQELADDHDRQSNQNRLLLLGAGESGKSTLLKQMIVIHGTGYSDDERLGMKPIIFSNIIESIGALCSNNKDWGTKIEEQTQVHLDAITNMLDYDAQVEHIHIDANLANRIKCLWEDPGIQDTYKNRSKFQLTDSTKYYLDKVEQIAAENYVPTLDDILRSRVATSGIVEMKFNIEGNTFIMLDVGGQRSERKKWINCFQDVTAVIFVAAMSAYDQVLFEDDHTNRMKEAIKVFKDFLFQEWFDKTAIIFFFNKKDLFAGKVQSVPVSSIFKEEWERYITDFPDAVKEEDIISREGKFVEKLFLDQRLYLDPEQNPQNSAEEIERVDALNRFINEKDIYTHHTCATDTDHIKVVFGIVKDIVIKRGLQRAGLM